MERLIGTLISANICANAEPRRISQLDHNLRSRSLPPSTYGDALLIVMLIFAAPIAVLVIFWWLS